MTATIQQIREHVLANSWYANNPYAVKHVLRSTKMYGTNFRCVVPETLEYVLPYMKYKSVPEALDFLRAVGITAVGLIIRKGINIHSLGVARWVPKPGVKCIASNMDCVIWNIVNRKWESPPAGPWSSVLGIPPDRKQRKAKRKVVLSYLQHSVADNGEIVTRNEINAAARKAGFGKGNPEKFQINILDREGYIAVKADLMDKLMEFNKIDERTYKADEYDCDDFALDLWYWMKRVAGVNAFGKVIDWSGSHSYNAAFLIQDDGSLVCKVLEPQRDDNKKYVELGSHKDFVGLDGYMEV